MKPEHKEQLERCVYTVAEDFAEEIVKGAREIALHAKKSQVTVRAWASVRRLQLPVACGGPLRARGGASAGLSPPPPRRACAEGGRARVSGSLLGPAAGWCVAALSSPRLHFLTTLRREEGVHCFFWPWRAAGPGHVTKFEPRDREAGAPDKVAALKRAAVAATAAAAKAAAAEARQQD